MVIKQKFIRENEKIKYRILAEWLADGEEGTVLSNEGLLWVGKDGIHQRIHPDHIQYSPTQLDKFKKEMKELMTDV